MLINNAAGCGVRVPPEAQATERSAKAKEASFANLLTLFLNELPRPEVEKDKSKSKLEAALHLAPLPAVQLLTNAQRTARAVIEHVQTHGGEVASAGLEQLESRGYPELTETGGHTPLDHSFLSEGVPEHTALKPATGEAEAEAITAVTGDGANTLVTLETDAKQVVTNGLSPPVSEEKAVISAGAQVQPSERMVPVVAQQAVAQQAVAQQAVAQQAVAQQAVAQQAVAQRIPWQPKTGPVKISEPGQAAEDTVLKPMMGEDTGEIQPLPHMEYFHQELAEPQDTLFAAGEGKEQTQPPVSMHHPGQAGLQPIEPPKREANAEVRPTEGTQEVGEFLGTESVTAELSQEPATAKTEPASKNLENPGLGSRRPVQFVKERAGKPEEPGEIPPNTEHRFVAFDQVKVKPEQGPVQKSLVDAVLNLQEEQNLLPKLTHHIRSLVDGERSEVRIQLRPDHLGEMRIKLSLERGVMVAEFAVQNEVVREIINSSLPQLHTALQDQGANVAEMTVNIGFGQDSEFHDFSRQANQFASNRSFRRSTTGGTVVGRGAEGEIIANTGRHTWYQVDLKA